ncbi:hypothetical protein MTR_6g007540 [Medicago truncatula]|uniref:RNase H type-1 domain-containing protein n=1 Tax=Medicago truncatula TaxID=3880 RepID=G7KIU3_MEDTR|nr:hypothetical protein MTR_6g007540 [Medicago truncatula]
MAKSFFAWRNNPVVARLSLATYVTEFGSIMDSSIHLCNNYLTNSHVEFIRRQANEVAHTLAKTATSSTSFQIYDDIPVISAMKKEHMKSIIKEFRSLEDYGGGVNQKSTTFSRWESHRSWGVTSTDFVKDIKTQKLTRLRNLKDPKST